MPPKTKSPRLRNPSLFLTHMLVEALQPQTLHNEIFMQPYGGVLVREIYCQGQTSRWRKQGNLNILAPVNQKERRRAPGATAPPDYMKFQYREKSLCLCISVGICVCIVWHLCQSSAKQVLQKNSGGVDPYSLP